LEKKRGRTGKEKTGQERTGKERIGGETRRLDFGEYQQMDSLEVP